ncbi:MAG: rod shape-determining protein MreC [Clostridiales bacterium]|nr:rod shape-determining protein MreC [Clostridiales bacterium]MCF8022278.1 rod shape-determining protein MreC [Clostridiales bacterium]
MTPFLTGKRLFLIAVFVFLLFIVARFAGGGSENLNPVEKISRDVLVPAYSVMTGVGDTVSSWISYPAKLAGAVEENKQLEKEINQLEAQLHKMAEIEQENIRLKRLLGWSRGEGQKFYSRPASVVSRNPENWLHTLVINKGSRDGIQQNMTVVSARGLVGRTINVSAKTTEVLLITDPRSGVGALIQRTRAPGIVEGTAGAASLRMNHIPAGLAVSEGDTVVTSGMGSIYKKGIAVGKIVNVSKETSGLFKVANLKPFVDFNRLEEVLIIR